MIINYIEKGFKGNQEGIYIYGDISYTSDKICYKLNEFFNIKNEVIEDKLYPSIFYYFYNDITFGINLNANDKIQNTIHVWIAG